MSEYLYLWAEYKLIMTGVLCRCWPRAGFGFLELSFKRVVLRVISSLKDVQWLVVECSLGFCGRIHKDLFLIKYKFLWKPYVFLLFILHTKTVVLEQESFRLWSILIQKLNIFSLFPKGSMDIKKEMGLVMHCN